MTSRINALPLSRVPLEQILGVDLSDDNATANDSLTQLGGAASLINVGSLHDIELELYKTSSHVKSRLHHDNNDTSSGGVGGHSKSNTTTKRNRTNGTPRSIVNNIPEQKSISKQCCHSLRSKTLFVLIFSILVMMSIFLIVLITVTAVMFSRLQNRMSDDSLLRVTRNMYNDLKSQSGRMIDYSNWDLLFNIFQNYSSEGLDEFINYQYYPNYFPTAHRVNFVGFYFLNGTLAKCVGYDLDTLETMVLPKELEYLPPGHPLNTNTEYIYNRIGGYMVLEDGRLMFATSTPIIADSIANYSIALMVYARYADLEYSQEIAQASQLCYTIYTLNPPSIVDSAVRSMRSEALDYPHATTVSVIDPEWENNKSFKKKAMSTRKESDLNGRMCWDHDSSGKRRLASFQVLKDLFGNNTILIRADEPVHLAVLGVKAFFFSYGIFVLVVLVISIFTLLLIEFTVLRPMSNLSVGLTEIVGSNDVSKRISLLDFGEIGILAQHVNGLLQSLDNSVQMISEGNYSLRRAIRKVAIEEQSCETVMSTLPDFVLLVNCSSGIIAKANQAFYSKLAYPPSETNGVLPLTSVLSLNNITDNKKMLEALNEICPKEESSGERGSVQAELIPFFSSNKNKIPVELRARKALITVSDQLFEGYVIVAKSLQEKTELLSHLEKQQAILDELRNKHQGGKEEPYI